MISFGCQVTWTQIIHVKGLRNITINILLRHFVMVPVAKVRWKVIWNFITAGSIYTLTPFTPVPGHEGVVGAIPDINYKNEKHSLYSHRLRPLVTYMQDNKWHMSTMRHILMHMWNAVFRQRVWSREERQGLGYFGSFEGNRTLCGQRTLRAI